MSKSTFQVTFSVYYIGNSAALSVTFFIGVDIRKLWNIKDVTTSKMEIPTLCGMYNSNALLNWNSTSRSVDRKNVLIFLFGCIQLNNSLERTTWLDYQLYYTFLWNIPHNILCPNSDLTLANRSSIMIKFLPPYPIECC